MSKKWLVPGFVVVLVAGGVTAYQLSWASDGKPASAVAVVAAGTGEVSMDVAATGTLVAASTRTLGFAVAGTVDAVAVRAGTKVKRGAVLAAIDTADATATAAEAAAAVAAAENELTAAREAAAVEEEEPQVVAAQAGPAQQSGSDAIYTAQVKLNRAEATLAEARDALGGTTIKAPIAGTVLAVAGPVGTRARAGETFVTLADTYRMLVDADFPEADASAIETGQEATVTLADRVGEGFAATVTQVDPMGTAAGSLVRYGVLLTMTKAPAGLLAGQSAQVEVRTAELASALRVPSTAVHVTGDDTGTVQAGTAGAHSARTVKIGLRGDRYTQIVDGLTAGQTVLQSW